MTDPTATPHSSEQADEALVGSTIGGQYTVTALLGAGGMGAVYDAVQTSLDRRVAIKVLHRNRVHVRTARLRFEREAVAVARLRHRNIVTVFDFGVEDAVGAYLVMERIDGETLQATIERQGPFAPAETSEIIGQVCSAISAAHACGVLHRDLKPQNILLEAPRGGIDGKLLAKVVDFGLAAILDPGREHAQDLTRDGAFLGTPLYLAPEICEDAPHDERSDVYSLGCILYAMLTGRPPFTGPTLGSILLQHARDLPTPPSQRASGVSPAVDAVVLRSLAKNPTERFTSPRELASALASAVIEGESPASDQPHPVVHLPRNITTFVGRDASIADVAALLASERLVTLTGPGGIGKSRLAREASSAATGSFADGLWWVDLSAIMLPGLVAQAVADAIGLRAEPNRAARDALCEELRGKRSLVVLDGCEHVLDACASLAEHLLKRCPGSTLLVTSQAALNVPGECVWSVTPLSIPLPDDTVDAAASSDAVRLFVERVRLQQPSFALTQSNAGAVAQLCARLEGIPLAIELAAARTRVLSVEQILARMDDRFRLLAGSARNRPQRQQTLRAAIDWSHDLLGDDERTLFRRLAVFAGGATLDAVEAVCGERDVVSVPRPRACEFDVVDLVSQLVDRSLVIVARDDAEPRYRMLETLRHYAAERLVEAGEDDAVRARHLDWCVAFAEGAGARLRPSAHESVLGEVEREYGNLRAALGWAIGAAARGERALRLCVAVMPYWEFRGLWGEGRRWLLDALAVPGDVATDLAIRAIHAAGTLSQMLGDFERAVGLYEKALAVEREVDDRASQAQTLRRLGDVYVRLGRYDDATACQEASLALFTELGDERGGALALSQLGMVAICNGELEVGRARYEESLVVLRRLGLRVNVAVVLHNLAEIRHRMGESAEACELLEQCLVVAREMDYKGLVATSLLVMGIIAADTGDVDGAETNARESLVLFRDLGDLLGATYALDAFARHAVLEENFHLALVLASAAGATRGRLGGVLAPYERASLDRYLDVARSALGAKDSARAESQGSELETAAAIALALERSER